MLLAICSSIVSLIAYITVPTSAELKKATHMIGCEFSFFVVVCVNSH